MAAVLACALVAGYRWLSADEPEQAKAATDAERVEFSTARGTVSNSDRLGSRASSLERDGSDGPRRGFSQEHERASSGAGIHGTVFGWNGAPLAGAEACVALRVGGGSGTTCSTSDAAGAFQLPAGTAGDTLIVTARAHETAFRHLAPSAEHEPVDVVLGASRTPNVQGVVLDAGGGPVPGALVLAQDSGDGEMESASWSDANGHFELTIAPGPVVLSAQAEAYAPSRVELDAPAHRVELVLAAGSTLVGTVVEEGSGRAAPGVVVYAYAVSTAHPMARSVVADPAGQFVFSGLHAGEYDLRASGDRWGGGEASASVALAEASAPIVIRVRPATTLTGVIRVGDEPCAGGSVWLHGPANVGDTSDAQGAIQMLGVLPGEYRITVECSGAKPITEDVFIATEPIQRQWVLDVGIELRGRLERANGKPFQAPMRLLPIARAGEESAAPRPPVDCAVDDTGAFECHGVDEGQYDFSIGSLDPVVAGSIVIAENSPSPAPIVLRLPPLANILVEIAEAGFPSGTLQVLARREGVPPLRAELNNEGYWLRDVPLGTYAIYLGPTSEIPSDAPRVTLGSDGTTARVALTSPTALTISGIAVDAADSPLPERWLHAESPGAPGEMAGAAAMTNERGEFVLKGLVRGVYELFDSSMSQRVGAASAGERGVIVRLHE